MIDDVVICCRTNGYVNFYSGSFDQEAWSDHVSEATRFNLGEQLIAAQLAEFYGAKCASLDWVSLRYPADATEVPIECSKRDFDSLSNWLV